MTAYKGPTPEQIEPILDDFLGVDSPHYEELRKRCAQRIFEVCAVMSGAPIAPSPEREYEPGMNPIDDAEFGMKP